MRIPGLPRTLLLQKASLLIPHSRRHPAHPSVGHPSRLDRIGDDAMTPLMRRIMTAASAALVTAWVFTPQGFYYAGSKHIDRYSLVDIEAEVFYFVRCPYCNDHIDGNRGRRSHRAHAG